MSEELEMTYDDVFEDDLRMEAQENERDEYFESTCRAYGLDPKATTWDDIEALEQIERLDRERNLTLRRGAMPAVFT